MQYLTNLWNALDFGSLESILLRLAAVFLCLTIHETATDWPPTRWETPPPSGLIG